MCSNGKYLLEVPISINGVACLMKVNLFIDVDVDVNGITLRQMSEYHLRKVYV